jgi:dolichol kinase
VIALPAAGTAAGEAVRAALLACGFAVVVLGTELWYRRLRPPVEWTRKTLHVAFGIAAGALPWILGSHWTFLVLAVVIAVLLHWARRKGLLPSLFDVERRSWGEIYFPLGVYLLFVVSAGHRVFYLISLITLVLCDALAALLGSSYGRHRYQVALGHRSLEGSAVFLFLSFVGTLLPLLLLTPLDRGTCVMVSLQLALLVTSFEAISPGGSDNLVLPLGTYYLLVKLTPTGSAAIGLQLAAQLGILGVTLLVAWRTRFLTFSGAIAAHLVLYAAFSLGGPPWIVAPATTLAALLALDRAQHRRPAAGAEGHDVRAIFFVAVVATLWIFADNSFATLLGPGPLESGHPFHVLFVGALAASLAVITYRTLESMPRLRQRSPGWRAVVAVALAYAVVVLPGLWALRGDRVEREMGIAAIVCGLGLVAELVLRRLLRRLAGGPWEMRRLAFGVLLATLLVLPLHLWSQGIEPWALLP